MPARRNGELTPRRPAQGRASRKGQGELVHLRLPDIVREFLKYDEEPYKYSERYEGEHSVTGKVRHVFNGTQIVDLSNVSLRITASTLASSASLPPRSSSTLKFIHPNSTPLPEIVDDIIQQSPIDIRRGLYKVSVPQV